MAKILEFKRRVKQQIETPTVVDQDVDGIGEYINSVISDYSLTVANRHWLLENMLMDIDDRLEGYKKELEEAEKKLTALVDCAEKEIIAAYSEFNAHVGGMTRAVKKLTLSSARQSASQSQDADPSRFPDHQAGPK